MHQALRGLLATLLLSLSAQSALAEDTPADQQAAYQAWAEEFVASLTPEKGTIVLPGGKATLEVPDNFYYLNPEDSRRVLEEAWGNPAQDLHLGMLFPAEYSPVDAAAWGVTLDYEEEGYVSDEDAADIDYADLLKTMQSDIAESSQARVEMGYEPIRLVGWATQPYYDAAQHKLYWAKELQFGDSTEHTLNFNVRVLGRQGVLLMNFVAGMSQLEEIQAGREEVLAMASFNEGHTYSEFNPEIDKVAAYGIGGLIAGKVLAKAGMLTAALLLLKKFWFLLLMPLIWLKKMIFGRKEA
ncbi:DUF2167 domain-containing protein [Shewanella sedimentimangrovi]|uniref:DUF2167 domain-containing protein n=1 Tax=Shewanella sedimentimangrovi TaxID=2814293 RepID=A0ABX7R0D0_9GAMM|nr:DUF2167 domain-containing protein [Shewanella sedimentimangrovi]QSX37242.1 DUF2167 domain-containing protein [Shewanella sedimentimangrovi]